MPPGRWFDGIELEELSPERGGYIFAKEKVQSTINHDKVESFDIENVYRIKNKYTWNRYKERRKEISQELGGAWVTEMRLFHGSPHAKKIATEGFDRGFAKKSGMFGDGVYFAEHSSKSNNYAFGAFKKCEKHDELHCEICIRRILICKVALGRMYETNRTVKSLPEGYHSVKAIPDTGFLLRPEYIIYNDDQVYPSFLVEYTAKYSSKGINNTSGSSRRGIMQTMKQSNPIKQVNQQRNSNMDMNKSITLIFVTTVLVSNLIPLIYEFYDIGTISLQAVYSNFSLLDQLAFIYILIAICTRYFV